MDSSQAPESLQPVLKKAERDLTSQLETACENVHVSEENTAELIRLEETLSIAAETAKEVVSLRRRLRVKGDLHSRASDTLDAAATEGDRPELS